MNRPNFFRRNSLSKKFGLYVVLKKIESAFYEEQKNYRAKISIFLVSFNKKKEGFEKDAISMIY